MNELQALQKQIEKLTKIVVEIKTEILPLQDLISEKEAINLLGKAKGTIKNRRYRGDYQEGVHFIKNSTGDIFFYKSKLLGL